MAPKRTRLAQRREALGLSQEDLAFLIRVDRTTIARWEGGETTPQPWQRPKLAVALQISLEELDDMLGVGVTTGDVVAMGESPEASPGVPSAVLRGYDGEIIDVDRVVDIDIAPDGWATLTYQYTLLNNTDKPLVRFLREVWFEHAGTRLGIEPLEGCDRNVVIQRIHEAPNLAKFACMLSPAVQPGETAIVRFCCTGGRFLDHLYWRQTIHRFTSRVRTRVVHRDAGRLLDYSAVEERHDGTEVFATDSVEWSYDDGDVVMSITRRLLRPGQAVTLRWSVENPAERNPR